MRGASRTRKLLAAIRAGDGAPTAPIQNFTGSELQDHNEIFISSCKSCGETSFQSQIYAITGSNQFHTIRKTKKSKATLRVALLLCNREAQQNALPAKPYAISEMNGTAAIEATIATEHTISASLKRHGKRLVQCFVFSKIDILIYRIVSKQLKETIVTYCIN